MGFADTPLKRESGIILPSQNGGMSMAYSYHHFEEQPVHDASAVNAAATERRLPEAIELVQRKLEWFGLHAMKITHVWIGEDSIQLDLASDDGSTCWLEIDKRTSAIKRCDGLLP